MNSFGGWYPISHIGSSSGLTTYSRGGLIILVAEAPSDARTVDHVHVGSKALARTVAGPAFIGLIAEALSNPGSSASFLAEFAERRRDITRCVLKRAIHRGEIRADTDVDLVIDALGGATTFRLLQRHAPLSRKFADALVTLVLSGCKTPQTGHARKET